MNADPKSLAAFGPGDAQRWNCKGAGFYEKVVPYLRHHKKRNESRL